MKVEMQGTSQSRSIGDQVEVSDDEAKRLINAGFAKSVAAKSKGKAGGADASNAAGG